MSSAGAPLTAASISDARLEQVQSRLSFLWSAAHSPLAVQAPALAAGYMRQLRLIAFHNDVTLSTPHTQLSACSQCSQVHLPGLNATVRVQASREVQRRRRRRQRRAAVKAASEQAEDQEMGIAEDAYTKRLARKRKRSLTPGTPARGSSPALAAASYPVHEVAVRCSTCRHVDFAGGISRKSRSLVRASCTSLSDLVSAESARAAQPQQADRQQEAAKTQRLLASLQSQAAVAQPAAKINAESADLLAKAQQRFQQSKAALTGQAQGASAKPANTPANSFFADQLKSAAGVAHVSSSSQATAQSSQPFNFLSARAAAAAPVSGPAAAPAPFAFSRSGAASVTPSKPGGAALYSLLHSSPPPLAAAPFASHAQPFVHSAKKSPAQQPTAPKTPAAAGQQAQASTMQGIAIIGGMKAAAAAKANTASAKGAGKGSQQKHKR